MRWTFLFLLVTFAIPSVQTHAQVRTPVPAKVMRARTVFVDNLSGFDRARDELVDELGRWQRLRIVYDRSQADLVAVLRADRARMTAQLAFADSETGENVWANTMKWSKQGPCETWCAIWHKESTHNRRTRIGKCDT